MNFCTCSDKLNIESNFKKISQKFSVLNYMFKNGGEKKREFLV